MYKTDQEHCQAILQPHRELPKEALELSLGYILSGGPPIRGTTCHQEPLGLAIAGWRRRESEVVAGVDMGAPLYYFFDSEIPNSRSKTRRPCSRAFFASGRA